jgi:glycerophosphoryl diester phosphodiesterase
MIFACSGKQGMVMRPVSRRLTCHHARVQIIAHRGLTSAAPENTLGAFQAALDAKVDAIEFDVLVTADGVPVVVHDEHLLRLTGVQAHVSRLSFDELSQLRVSVAGSQAHAIPTLASVLDLLAGKVPIFVELKAVVDPVIGFRSSRIAAEAALPLLKDISDAVVSSFDPAGPALIRSSVPLPIAQGVVHAAACTPWASNAKSLGCSQVHLEWTLVDAEAVEAATSLGLDVLAWTVNDPAVAKSFADMGVAGVFSDTPVALREQLGGDAHF